jgi:hypothetical protein
MKVPICHLLFATFYSLFSISHRLSAIPGRSQDIANARAGSTAS